jgi:hypothetical protein
MHITSWFEPFCSYIALKTASLHGMSGSQMCLIEGGSVSKLTPHWQELQASGSPCNSLWGLLVTVLIMWAVDPLLQIVHGLANVQRLVVPHAGGLKSTPTAYSLRHYIEYQKIEP